MVGYGCDENENIQQIKMLNNIWSNDNEIQYKFIKNSLASMHYPRVRLQGQRNLVI